MEENGSVEDGFFEKSTKETFRFCFDSVVARKAAYFHYRSIELIVNQLVQSKVEIKALNCFARRHWSD